METTTYLINGTVITPYREIPGAGVKVTDGKIEAVLTAGAVQGIPGARIVDVGARYISPGFIDIHVHGGGNADVMDRSPQTLIDMAVAHAAGGATGIVPTTLAAAAHTEATYDDMVLALEAGCTHATHPSTPR